VLKSSSELISSLKLALQFVSKSKRGSPKQEEPRFDGRLDRYGLGDLDAEVSNLTRYRALIGSLADNLPVDDLGAPVVVTGV